MMANAACKPRTGCIGLMLTIVGEFRCCRGVVDGYFVVSECLRS